uniref:Tetraspanin n=1 Tax=Syphacia muris TaxID=451379 RepID=A0A0N5A9F5_9BILA
MQVCGLSLIVAGTVLQLKYEGLLDILGDSRLATSVWFLIAGALCASLGFLGCCGAIRENYCLTLTFAILLSLLLLLETAAAITAYALHQPLEQSLSHQLRLGLPRYNKTGSAGVTAAWDQVQRQFNCCGVYNSSDWSVANIPDPPDSCCIEYKPECGKKRHNLQSSGCMERVEEWLLMNAAIIGGISAVVGCVQVIGICFACCLSKSILKEYHEFYY